jgi:carbonic anhydrase/acetyltransferase-like protein (isoleucine patch superfamily)
MSKTRVNIDTQHSDRRGLLGLFETAFRRFKLIGALVVLMPVYLLGVFCFAIALTPGALLFGAVYPYLEHQSALVWAFGVSALVASAYVLFGFSMILVTPALNFICRTYPRPWRGPYYSLQTIQWGIHNVFTYMPRYTFLEFLTPTPFNVLFYRLLGMKVGEGTQINTTNISDPCLIEIGEKVTIGGSATIVGHYGQGGFLVLAPVKIGKGATIGLRATIMGDVEIGEYAKILPNSVLLPKTRIGAGETWGGVPAVKLNMTTHLSAQRRERRQLSKTQSDLKTPVKKMSNG